MFMRCDEQRWCDMFAGSGAIGLEALSRGAKEVIFIEKENEAIKIIKANIQTCKMTPWCTLIHDDALSYMKTHPQLEKFDVIFCDPPYELSLQLIIDNLLQTSWYDIDTTFVFERHANEDTTWLTQFFNILKQRKVGQSQYVIAKVKV